jgi:hypothetical protein
MHEVVHVIGNGDNALLFDNAGAKGTRVVCNMPPFDVRNVWATCMVDFKMMMALTEGSVQLDMYDWVLGNRPKLWMEKQSTFYMRYARCIREFYTHVPDYAGPPGSPLAATNFNCGHMAVHYSAKKLKGKEIHMYGFDTLFDHNMRSVTDLFLSSDRSMDNNYRLLNIWRPIWHGIFDEFKDVNFVLHHKHSSIKIPLPENAEVFVHKK